jgi:tetratricopeptide (TPR) repeat protein
MSGRRAAAALAALVLAAAAYAAVAPEWRKAAAKRRLREGEALVLAAARASDPASRASILRDAEEVLEDAAARLPHDPRPAYLLGSCALLRGDAASALELYRRSLAVEERPETDLNLSRAHMALGHPAAAARDALRAAWLAPEFLQQFPENARKPMSSRIAGITRGLSLGRREPPKLWEGDLPAKR